MTDAAVPRISGMIWTRSVGILRVWKSRPAVVTADGILQYKKKTDAGKTTKIDLVKATFPTTTIAKANGYYYFELHYGSTQVAIGFPVLQDARVWLSEMMEAIDENNAGRRAWIANLQKLLTLHLRDRRKLVPAMADRDWFIEWNFCLRSLKNDREPVATCQRRLRRLYTIWLQFELFTEILAEIFFLSVQQRDARGLAWIESFERAASDFALNGGRELRPVESSHVGESKQAARLRSLSAASTLSFPTAGPTFPGKERDLGVENLYAVHDDVDKMKFAGIHLEFASKSWQGHKRLAKETALFAKFRSLTELFLSESTAENGKLPPSLRAVLSKLPTFPLVSAFTIRGVSVRGVSVVAIAEPLSSKRSILTTIDNRDLAGFSMALREAKMLRYFPCQEVHPRYNDVLVNSLRSPMVHGVLIRAVHGASKNVSQIETLSAHDVSDLMHTTEPQWIPYLDLVCYQLVNEMSLVENLAANEFLLMATRHSVSQPLTGDIVITVNAKKSKLLLDLPEAFVMKHDMEIYPLVQKLQDVKKNNAIYAVAASSQSFARCQNERLRPVDTGIQVAQEYEDEVKKLFVQHIKEFAVQLATLGDAPKVKVNTFGMAGRLRVPNMSRSQWTSSRSRLSRFNTFSSMPRPIDVFSSPTVSDYQHNEFEPLTQPRLQRLMSTQSSMARTLRTGGLGDSNSGTYVIDTLHLRQAMREGGVNVCFLPLVFLYLSKRDQLGVQVLVASEIVARLAKNLFRYRMLNEDTGKKSCWKSKKSRLIKFVDSIMHGLFHKNLPDGRCSIRECSGDQFWSINGPIMYLLGAFSSSFAMDTKALVNSSNSCLEKYRDLLKVNPAILFNSLLHVFQARLTKSILPELHENRFVSVPFLRNEDDLTFNYEEDDPKLALRIHPDLLWSHLQFFRVQFEALAPDLPVSNEENRTSKIKLGVQTAQTTWTQYYRTLSQIFRQILVHPQLARLEKAIQSWQDLTAVRAHLGLALRTAAAPLYHRSDSSKTYAVTREHCRFAYLRMASSKALFPIEYKLALRCLELISTGEELAEAMKESDELLDWLRFFYRPANPSQFAKGSSSHPVYSIQYSTNDTRLEGKIQDYSMLSLRERFHRQQLRQSWMSVIPNVDAYYRRIEVMRRDPADIAAARAVLSEMGLASHASLESISPSGGYDGVDESVVMGLRPDATWAEKSQASFSINSEDSKMPSSMYSSRRDALCFIECFFLPPLANNSFLVAGDALVNNEKIASRITSVRADINDEGSVPGLAVAWGKTLGLPLAEKENGIESLTVSLRPKKENASTIRMVSFPSPLRRVVQIACGYRHTALVADDQYLYTFGHGECGRLGHGTEEACTEPRVVGYFASLIAAEGAGVGGILDVSCGREHTMVVIASGDLYGFGSGEGGRLGTCETGSSLYPSRVMDLQNIAAVACGREHTLALTRKGRVFSFGVGRGGRLGNGSETDKEQPFAICGMEGYRITAIDAGECHSCALSNEGDVFTWGFGNSGSLGHGNRDNCLKPRKLEGLWTRSSNVERDGDNLTRAESVVTSIACGSYHTLAATSDGELYGWDDATAGQLGDEYVSMPDMVVLIPKKISVPTVSGIRCIACGTFTSAVCTNEGQLFLWGSSAAGKGDALELEDASVKNIGALSEFKRNHAVAITQKLAYY
ncbi:unnamed protein product [Peronospora destructor]|uniref:RCC1-like domain-containing protein n=1 Tax=Peronospora destructor TaxID=86335 RepID=A0AAV0TNW3_9STRA|nr:unnamed protein product [Peronospora destructor]